MVSSLLQDTMLATEPLDAPAIRRSRKLATQIASKTTAGLVGITTAKRPHIGHGFLLAKGLSELQAGQPLIVELNDQGPRVARAVARLALQQGADPASLVDEISAGLVSTTEFETAYKQRGDIAPANLPRNFALTSSNRYYEDLLRNISPNETNIFMPLANSSSDMETMHDALVSLPSSEKLFSGDCMALAGSAERSTPIAKFGQPTVAGILGAIGTSYDVVISDSPTPLSARELSALAEAGINISLQKGMGVMFDFAIASGTKGDAPLLEELYELATDLEPRIAQNGLGFMVAIRRMLNNAYFVKNETGSISPNYSQPYLVTARFAEAVASLDDAAPDLDELYRPLNFAALGRQIAREYLQEVYAEFPAKGKIKVGEVATLLDHLPALTDELSTELLDATMAAAQANAPAPKGAVSNQDTAVINSLRTNNAGRFFGLLASSIVSEPAAIQARLANSETFEQVRAGMGYTTGEVPSLVNGIVQAGEVYGVN